MNREKKLKRTSPEARKINERYMAYMVLLEHPCTAMRRFIIQRIKRGFQPKSGIKKINKIERAGEILLLNAGVWRKERKDFNTI
jgi:hypothetical protein